MDAKMSLIVLTVLLCYGLGPVLSANKECNLKEFIKCARLISEIEFSNACSQLSHSLTCIEDLSRACNKNQDELGPVCADEEEYPYCSMLDGAMQAPMASVEKHETLCASYVKLNTCSSQNCGDGGDEFRGNAERNMGMGGSEEDCSLAAIQSCVQPVDTVTQVDKDSCVAVATAKTCFLDKLMDCSGSNVQQRRSDVIIAGLVEHIKKCKEQDIGFSKDGSICVPNPLDVFIIDDPLPANGLNKEYCTKIIKLGNTLESYLLECNATSYNSYNVKRLVSNVNYPRVHCYKAGFKDAGTGNGAEVRGHPSQILAITIIMAVLVLAIRAAQ